MNKYNLITALALLSLVVALPVYAFREGSRLATAQQQLQAESIQHASGLYLEYCADCHNPNGEGNEMNPALNRLGMADADPGLLFNVIARAGHGSSMTAWHLQEGGILNDQQIGELVTLIRFADWEQVEQIAEQSGYEYPGQATLDLENISTSLLPEEDPHQCIACHEDPQVHRGQFGLDCVRCHTLEAWTPASLTRHTFPLDHGDSGEVACETCHIDTYAANTCYQCHDHDPEEMDQVHLAEGIEAFDNCQACHPTGIEGEGGQIWQEWLEQNRANDITLARSSTP
jgi:mono/diheme cytochrome c family protein